MPRNAAAGWALRLTENGAPRPMKMGNIASPWHYDGALE